MSNNYDSDGNLIGGKDTKSSEVGIEKIFYAWLQYEDIGNLTGKILTIVDACISDEKQNKAMKDLIKRAIWFDWAENLDRVEKDAPVGMPDVK